MLYYSLTVLQNKMTAVTRQIRVLPPYWAVSFWTTLSEDGSTYVRCRRRWGVRRSDVDVGYSSTSCVSFIEYTYLIFLQVNYSRHSRVLYNITTRCRLSFQPIFLSNFRCLCFIFNSLKRQMSLVFHNL